MSSKLSFDQCLGYAQGPIDSDSALSYLAWGNTKVLHISTVSGVGGPQNTCRSLTGG